jgi:hypothetical protein
MPNTASPTTVTISQPDQPIAATTSGATSSTITAMALVTNANRPHALPCSRGSMSSAFSEKLAIHGE